MLRAVLIAASKVSRLCSANALGQALGIEDFVQLESQIAGTERLGHGGHLWEWA
jgi:hypothetical protein